MENSADRVLLVGSYIDDEEDFLYTMEELKNLAQSCELEVIGIITQKIKMINARTYFGSGKVDEIKDFVENNDIDIVVVNDDLSASQTRNIQESIGCRVIDRTVLILDIFAKRAKTKEAILQVEIAQLQYLLPRIGLFSENNNERLGLRGPGETRYELDRRKLEKRISQLEEELRIMVNNRQTQRKKRRKKEIPVVSLVGYTNSGKSTLLNTLLEFSVNCNEDKQVFAEDMLFATLETTTRQIVLENNHQFLVTDTVGFVSHLPHQLIKAFRSTLEEITESDLILHVIDIGNKNYEKQKQITEKVLKEIGVEGIPIINVYNKIDLIECLTVEDGVYISAKRKANIDDLINEIEKNLFKNNKTVKMLIPYTNGHVYNYLKENAYIINEDYLEKGIYITVELSDYLFQKYKHLVC
ncbi:MAG TPA: GTPase HflX [Haloplasmataceae bacterium]